MPVSKAVAVFAAAICVRGRLQVPQRPTVQVVVPFNIFLS